MGVRRKEEKIAAGRSRRDIGSTVSVKASTTSRKRHSHTGSRASVHQKGRASAKWVVDIKTNTLQTYNDWNCLERRGIVLVRYAFSSSLQTHVGVYDILSRSRRAR